MTNRMAALLSAVTVTVVATGCEEANSPAAPTNLNPTAPALLQGGASPVIVTELGIGEFPGSGSGVSGNATLSRSTQGLWADIEVEGLTTGYAYSVWWAIFDNPNGCDGNCDPPDLTRRQAQGSLVNGGGFVAAGSTVSHQSHLARHDVEGKSVHEGDASGIDNPYGAEVHVAIRSHGEAETDPADLAEQTSVFGSFCNLPDPPVPGGCQNVGLVRFMPPGAPGDNGSQ